LLALNVLTNQWEITLAVKTGDVRGAEEGVSALTRSCAGQQIRFADANPISMAALSPKPGAIG
jgi:hypothetical protein